MIIKYLHNIGDNKLKLILNLFLLHGEAYRQSFVNCSANFQPKFNELVLGAIVFEIFWRQIDRQANKQTNRGKNIISRRR